jgi:hypothetical protein
MERQNADRSEATMCIDDDMLVGAIEQVRVRACVCVRARTGVSSARAKRRSPPIHTHECACAYMRAHIHAHTPCAQVFGAGTVEECAPPEVRSSHTDGPLAPTRADAALTRVSFINSVHGYEDMSGFAGGGGDGGGGGVAAGLREMQVRIGNITPPVCDVNVGP